MASTKDRETHQRKASKGARYGEPGASAPWFEKTRSEFPDKQFASVHAAAATIFAAASDVIGPSFAVLTARSGYNFRVQYDRAWLTFRGSSSTRGPKDYSLAIGPEAIRNALTPELTKAGFVFQNNAFEVMFDDRGFRVVNSKPVKLETAPPPENERQSRSRTPIATADRSDPRGLSVPSAQKLEFLQIAGGLSSEGLALLEHRANEILATLGAFDGQPFARLLVALIAEVDGDGELARAFRASAAHQKIGEAPFATGASFEQVAKEIAEHVTDTWGRRKLDHPGEPWIRNPSKFVSHVYKRWLDAGVLQRRHLLQHDPLLYASYARHIGEKPEDDLGLPAVPTGRKKAKGDPQPKP